jgi:hypothetical protein
MELAQDRDALLFGDGEPLGAATMGLAEVC